MKTFSKLLISALITISSLNIHCIIDSISLDRYRNQVICRIGDSHITVYNQGTPGADIERQHTLYIQDLLQYIGQKQKPTTIILESGKMLLQSVELASLTDKTLAKGFIPYVALQAQEYTQKYPSLHFIHADKRTQKLATFYQIFAYFCTNKIINSFIIPFMQMLPEDINQKLYKQLFGKHIKDAVLLFDNFIQENPQGRDGLFQDHHSILSKFSIRAKFASPYTLQELFGEAEQAKKEFEKLTSSLGPQDPCHSFIENIIQKYDHAIRELDRFFKSVSSYSPHQSCIDAICDAVKEKSFTEIYEQWQWAEQSADTFDANLAIELSQALHDDHNVIIICGSQHSTNLDELINKLGCEKIFPPHKDLCPDGAHCILSGQILEKLFSTIKVTFTPQSVEQQVTSQAQSCYVCQKPAKNLCSKCKKIYYCSRDCQAKDWQKHKLICKASDEKK
jgi:hypothetical protein